MNGLREHVERTIHERRLFRRGQRILVAVSGGVDSMVLLHLLNTIAPDSDGKLFVAHLNHQLRGRSSDADERLVSRVAAKLELPVHVAYAEVKAHAKRTGNSIEMSARELRHRFLADVAGRRNCDCIALAHHADDQVELFFLRLLRGSGGRGLGGMKWRTTSPADHRIKLIRPLLDVSRSDIEQYARANKIPFRVDATNVSRDPLRNRIRHDLLPLVRRRFQPALNRTVLRAMEVIGAESALVEEKASEWLKKRSGGFSKLSTAVQRAVVQSQLHEHAVTPDFDLIEALRTSPDLRVMVSPDVRVTCNTEGRVTIIPVPRVTFRQQQKAATLHGSAGTITFAGHHIQWKLSKQRGAILPARVQNRELFDAQKVGRRLILRHWQPGDRFQPIGMNSAVKLQDWFVNQRIPRERRGQLLVAATANGEIFWVQDQRIGERFKLDAHTTRGLLWAWKCA